MKLIRWAVTHPVGTAMLCLAILLFGLVGMRTLAIDLLPAVDMPRISVTTAYEGVAPEEIETLITRPLEQRVSTIEGVTRIESTSAEGLSRIQLQYEWGAELDEAVNDVRAQIDRVRNRLPEQADAPIIFKFDLSSASVATLGLAGSGDARRLRYLADEVLSRRLERIPGVAAVDVRGGRIREIRVELDASRLSAYDISPSTVSAALAAENGTASVGNMREAEREVVVRVEGEFESIADIEAVVVARRDGRAITVGDLGRVVDGVQEVRDELWIDDVPGIRLRISKQSGANTVEVVRDLQAEVAAINADYAGRLEMSVLRDSGKFIEDAIQNVVKSLAVGGTLAIFVLFAFLRNWRATVVIGLSIPFSILATFGLMFLADITLNLISFGGLALGIGMLVDNAIVILENVYRRFEGGDDPLTAAIEGTHEVAGAVVSGTLTTIAVFVPVIFVGGFAGVFFKEMAMVVCFALACSLLVAVTLVPMMLARLLRRDETSTAGGSDAPQLAGFGPRYAGWVSGALSRPGTVLMAGACSLVLAAAAVPWVGTELMPEPDEGRLDADVELPLGTPLEVTTATVAEMERRVREVVQPDELEHVTRNAGPEAWWRPAGSNQGEVELTLTPTSERKRTSAEIMEAVRVAVEGIPGADIRIRQQSSNLLLRVMRGGGDDRLTVQIRGHELDVANRLAEEVRAVMDEIDGITETRVDREDGQLQRVVRVDRARLGDLGLGLRDVADALEHYVLGHVATRYRDDGDEYDIRVVLRAQDRERIAQLPTLPLVAADGREVPLSSVARIEESLGPSSIAREDQERVLKVSAGLSDRELGEIVADLERGLAGITRPEGFRLAIGGEAVEQRKAFGSLLIGGLLAVFLVYAVMAVQFESLRGPLVVMTSVPVALVGVVVTFLLSGTTLNLNSGLGMVILVGIVVNNAIVLVDYTNILRERDGLGIRDAIVRAARTRLRPILMTTLTTALGMLPLAIAPGEGSELQSPLARAVVGGLVWSTLVSLVLVPCAYLLVEGRRGSKSS